MNEVFETLSDVFEELRSEAGDREYFVRTEDAANAVQKLEKKNKAYKKYLLNLSTEDREFLEDYMDAVDHAHYKEEQRAYYQGLVDGIQILAGLDMLQKNVNISKLLEKITG